MKHIYSLLMCCIVAAGLFVWWQTHASYSTDREYLDALQWMYQSNMTRYKKSSDYNPGWFLLREQAAKFFSQYAVNNGLKRPAKNEHSCDFADIKAADESLQSAIQMVCRYGFMKGSGGKFHPKKVMSKAEVLTVLVRMKAWLQDETWTPWWKWNFEKARELLLTKETNVWAIDTDVTRYEMALLLSRAAWRSTASTVDYDLEETYRLMQMMTKYLRTE